MKAFRYLLLNLTALFWVFGSSHAAPGAPAAAQRLSFPPWALSYAVLSDSKGYCRLSRTWSDGVSLEFVSFGLSQTPVISIINPSWNIAANAATTVTFQVNAATYRTLSLSRLSAHQAIASDTDNAVEWVLDQFASGKALFAVFANGARYGLDSSAGAAARQKFDECARYWAGHANGNNADAAANSGTPDGPPPSPNEGPGAAPLPPTGGTGFALTRDGIVITNAHVIAGCHAIVAAIPGKEVPATLVAQDQTNDLAALRAAGIAFGQVVAISSPATIAVGEKAVTYGFPLYGALSTEGNFAIGYVSALAGMHDDSRYMQISTPIQPGNSGGPLLDAKGNLIGVVASALDAVKMEKIASQLPENVNFAIQARTLLSFLRAHNLPINPPKLGQEKTDVELAVTGRAIAVRIACKG